MRHVLILVGIVALAVGGYFLLPRTATVEGRVRLHGLGGEEIPGTGARVACYRAETFDGLLRQWLRDGEDAHGKTRLELQAARSYWNEMTARRDEAARILRVAERANSADLEICRARHREAAADAEDAFRRMEELGTGFDATSDPARFLAGLPPSSGEVVADSDGIFRVEVPRGAEIFLVASLAGKREGEQTMVWLRGGRFDEGEKVQFSNADLLTAGKLAEIARAEKRPGSPLGSPAE